MVLQMLCGVLRTVSGMDVVAAVTSLRHAMPFARLGTVDLLIIDSAGCDEDAGGPWRAFLAEHPLLPCIVITGGKDRATSPAAIVDHAIMHVDKSQGCDDLLVAIARTLGDRLAEPPVPIDDRIRLALTKREHDVFHGLGMGWSNR